MGKRDRRVSDCGHEAEVWRVNTCKTCRWYAAFDGVCCNGDSEHRADFRVEDETCEEWEQKELEEM